MAESSLSFWPVLAGAVAALLVIVFLVSRVFRALRDIKTKARKRNDTVASDE